jgi:DNA polymerase-3 subunit alpha
MAAVLNSESNDVERISFLIDECKDMGIDVQAPDVNESFKDFAVSSEMKIRFGIGAIKNVGVKVAEGIVEERQKNGAFKSITDFVTRLDIKLLNKKSMESMIKAGVFDSLEERNKLLQNLEKMLEHARAEEKAKQSAQQGLFGGGSYKAKQVSLEDCPPSNKQQNLHWEKELLGLYVSGHILEKYRKIIEKRAVPISKVCKELTNDEPVNFFTAGFEKRIMEGTTVKVAGVIHKMKKIITKNGKAMLFVELEDLTSKIEVIAFPKILEAKPEVFKDNNIILVSGKADNKDGVPKIIANDVIQLVKPEDIQSA